MTPISYIVCFSVGVIGMALQTVLKIKSLQDKARVANMPFKASSYFKEDWLSVVASLLTIILFLFFIDNITKWKPETVKFLKIGFAFIGYTGSDVASRLFSVVSKKINSVIDIKTDIADGITPKN